MKKVNKSRFAILGMLFDKPRSGYEIKTFMLQSTVHFWQESDASIYPMLKKLESEGKVTSRSESRGKRERNVFEITPAGKKEFIKWLDFPVVDEETHRNELLLKLFFSANASKEEVIKKLLVEQKKVRDAERQFEDIEENLLSQVPDSHPHKQFWMMTLRYGVINAKAETQWLSECIKILSPKK